MLPAATEDIMALPDISVDESEQIPQILEPLYSGVHEAVLPTAPGAAARAGAGAGRGRGMLGTCRVGMFGGLQG